MLFEDGEPFTFGEFMDAMLTLRGSNSTTVKDIAHLAASSHAGGIRDTAMGTFKKPWPWNIVTRFNGYSWNTIYKSWIFMDFPASHC